jgi:hypothetical protein
MILARCRSNLTGLDIVVGSGIKRLLTGGNMGKVKAFLKKHMFYTVFGAAGLCLLVFFIAGNLYLYFTEAEHVYQSLSEVDYYCYRGDIDHNAEGNVYTFIELKPLRGGRIHSEVMDEIRGYGEYPDNFRAIFERIEINFKEGLYRIKRMGFVGQGRNLIVEYPDKFGPWKPIYKEGSKNPYLPVINFIKENV